MIRPRSIRPLLLFLGTLFMATGWAQLCDAQITESGTSSRKARDEAQRMFPMQQLTAEAQQKIRPIIQRPSIYRRLPVTSINIDPDYFLFLVRHPEVVINIWQLMGVTEMTAERVAPFQLATDDGAGTLGNIELVYGSNNTHIYYGEGEYNGSVIARNLRGKIVILLTSDYQLDAEGNTVATSQMDIFVKIENATLGLIAKTLHPIIGSTADHNFTESIKFLERLNETTIKNGPGVQGMAHRLDTLTQQVRRDFVQVAGLVSDRAKAGVKYSYQPPAQSQTQVADQRMMNPHASSSYQVQSQGSSLQRPMPTKNRQPRSVLSQPVKQTFSDQGQGRQPPVYSTSRKSFAPNRFFNKR